MTTNKNSLAPVSTTTNNKQRVTLFINPSILKQTRVQAVVEETTLTTLVERALIAYLPKETTIKKISIKTDNNL
jgi:hypothetical protein